MQPPGVTFWHVILAMRHHRVPITTGQEHAQAAIIIFFFPLLFLGFVGGLISTAVFGTFLSFGIILGITLIGLVAALLLWLVWRFRVIVRVLKAEQATGTPLPVPTKSDTAYFWGAGVLLLLLTPEAIFLFLLPDQDRIWGQFVWILLVYILLSIVGAWKRKHPRRLR